MMKPKNPHIPPPERRPISMQGRPSLADGDERSIGDLLRELSDEVRTLLRQEIQLARSEIKQNITKASTHVGFIAAGGFIAYAGFLALVMAVALLLGTFMPDWLGFLIAGALVVAGGYMLLQTGLSKLKRTDFTLEHTADTLQEDKLWIKQEAQEVKNDPMHLGAST